MAATELYLMIQWGAALGFLSTLLLILVTASFGLTLIRFQGLMSLQKLMIELGSPNARLSHLLDSVFIIFAGFLFIIPGFLSDLIALLLLIKPIRFLFKGPLLSIFKKMNSGNFHSTQVHIRTYHSHAPETYNDNHPSQDAIEVEYQKKD